MGIFSKLFGKDKEEIDDPVKDEDSSEVSPRQITPKALKFNINAMLDDVANAVTMKSNKKGLSLVFETDNDVPSRVIGDRLLLGEVLINLIEHMINLTDSGDIKLKLERLAVEDELRLKFKIIYTESGLNHTITINKLNDFFHNTDSSISDADSNNLLISREILQKMNAIFNAESKIDSSTLTIEVALQAKNLQEKRHYRLPSRAAIGLKSMILDEELEAANALQQKLEYFKHNVTVHEIDMYDDIEHLDFSDLDILFVSDKVFTTALGDKIISTRLNGRLKFVLVENMFRPAKNDKNALKTANSLIFKPVNQQTTFDLLINLYGDDSSDNKSEKIVNKRDEDHKIDKMSQIFVAKEGLHRAGNDMERFKKILNQFLYMYPDSNVLLSSLSNAEKLEDAHSHLLNLKSILGNIGAYRLAHHITIMEEAVLQHDQKNLVKYVEIFKVEFNETRNTIENFIIHIKSSKENI